MIDTLRKSDLATIAQTLENQRTRRVDIVVPARSLRVQDARFVVPEVEREISAEGVTNVDGYYEAGIVADEQVANKLKIPADYLRRLHEGHEGLYDANVNWWLEREDRKFMVRLLHHKAPHERTNGFMRAFLGNRYRFIDNLDILLAALAGMHDAGIEQHEAIIDADLTERRMYVRVTTPTVQTIAQEWLKNYRGPGGALGRDNPIVWAGFVVANSEVGQGAFSITPRMVIQVCKNGQTVPKDMTREVHLGAQLDDGVVDWSHETDERNVALVRSMTTDAVRTFLSREYLDRKVTEIEAMAGAVVNKPQETIEAVAKRVVFTKSQRDEILNYFIDGADRTAGGVANAITLAAQDQEDGDVAAAMESKSWLAMEYIAKMPVLVR